MKLMIMGHARHGKDTVADILREQYSIKCISSSWHACLAFVFDALKDKYRYTSAEECFNDRNQHRQKWFDLISAYNEQDKSRMAHEIFSEHDAYIGCRNSDEFIAIRDANLFDFAIWVDRSQHLPAENQESCTVSPHQADYLLDNNGSLHDLKLKIIRMMQELNTTAARREALLKHFDRHTRQLINIAAGVGAAAKIDPRDLSALQTYIEHQEQRA